jgi:hypothetical protein
MDQEKYEHQISQLRQRTEALERELVVLREGSNVRPLEEKIQVAALHQQLHQNLRQQYCQHPVVSKCH